jgi:hypothetical protein
MLSNDVEWYVKNIDQISAFERWIEIIKSDIPKQISQLIHGAAEKAIVDLQNKRSSDADYSSVHRYQGSWGYEIYWSLRDSWNEEQNIGACITTYVPKGIDWLTSKSDDVPALSLGYYGGRGSKTKEVGELMTKSIGKISPKLGIRIDRLNEDKDFICVKRLLNREINTHALIKPKELNAVLVEIFKDFTYAMRPGLKNARAK